MASRPIRSSRRRAAFAPRRRTAQALGATTLLVLCGCGSSGSGSPSAEPSGGDSGAGVAGTVAGTGSGSPAGAAGGVGGVSDAGAPSAGVEAGGTGALPPFAIVATNYGACALDDAGAIHCWGATPGEWQVPAGAFVELRSGDAWVCAIRADRSYECFAEPVGESGALDFAPDAAASDLAVAGSYVCVINAAGEMTCGRSAFNTMDITPPAGKQFEHVSVGAGFVCATLAVDQSVQCWGFAGEDAAECQNTPAAGQLAAPTGAFVSLSGYGYATCALNAQGKVTCWGAGEAADDAAATCAGLPYNFGQAAPADGKFRSVNVGWNHSCGVKTDGTLACWGTGTADECTLDANDNCRQSFPPAGQFEQVASGFLHSCAITADRKVKCWGYDGGGTALSPGGRTEPPAVFQ